MDAFYYLMGVFACLLITAIASYLILRQIECKNEAHSNAIACKMKLNKTVSFYNDKRIKKQGFVVALCNQQQYAMIRQTDDYKLLSIDYKDIIEVTN